MLKETIKNLMNEVTTLGQDLKDVKSQAATEKRDLESRTHKECQKLRDQMLKA